MNEPLLKVMIELLAMLSNIENLSSQKLVLPFAQLQENLEENIPLKPEDYGLKVTESNLDNYKNFFNKSFVDDVYMVENTVTIKKAYADPVSFEFVDFGPTQETLDSINESFNPWDFAEIIFLSKYIGDYNITKYGSKLTFENAGHTLVLERI